MKNVFAQMDDLNDREQALAQWVCYSLLGNDQDQAGNDIRRQAQVAGFTQEQLQQIAEAVGRFEEALQGEDESLSDLLASATKSTCCS